MDISVVMPVSNESMTKAIEFVRSKGISCGVVDTQEEAKGDYVCECCDDIIYVKSFLHTQFVFLWYVTGGHFTHYICKNIVHNDEVEENSESYFYKREFTERKDFIDKETVLMSKTQV